MKGNFVYVLSDKLYIDLFFRYISYKQEQLILFSTNLNVVNKVISIFSCFSKLLLLIILFILFTW